MESSSIKKAVDKAFYNENRRHSRESKCYWLFQNSVFQLMRPQQDSMRFEVLFEWNQMKKIEE
jgi:hypothetical protein